MNSIKKYLKYIQTNVFQKSRFLNIFPRIFFALKEYDSKYFEILKWSIRSKEDTNYTYEITETNIVYLALTISVVVNKPYKVISAYINEVIENDELKNHVINSIKKSKFKHIADFRCEFGRRLGWYAIARAIKPKVVIETWIDKWLWWVLLCEAISKNTNEWYKWKYYWTDINPDAGYLISGKYKKYWEILYGDSIESLNKLNVKIDLFINDSDYSQDYEYDEYLAIKDKLTKKAIVLWDNSECSDKLSKFSIKYNRKFIYFDEQAKNHWTKWAGIGISF